MLHMEVSFKWCYGGCFINAQVMLLAKYGLFGRFTNDQLWKKIISMCSNNKTIINSVDIELIACLECKL